MVTILIKKEKKIEPAFLVQTLTIANYPLLYFLSYEKLCSNSFNV